MLYSANNYTEDTHVRNIIRESLQQIMHSATEQPKNVQQNNAQNAVLFEAINLLIHLDTEHNLMMQISSKLGKFIQSRETNVRYLGLDAMTHFAARSETLDPIKRHQNLIIGSLRDRDISVRRKAMDLLYSMCDSTNAVTVVGELMKYLQGADYAIREEMVLKIAILTEKYATDPQWYIDVSLRLLAMAGDHVPDAVWQRVIQIVTNNEELQAYAAQNILNYIQGMDCHDTLVKIGGYILGEFGHLIADNKGCSPIDQYMALQQKMYGAPSETKGILLSTFVKFVNLFPEIKPQLVQAFTAFSHSPETELQQRACEYLNLATLPTDDLLRTVCDEMPPFSERTSVLLSRLHGKQSGTSDKRTWVIGGKDANKDPKEFNLTQQQGLKRTFTTIVNGTKVNGSPTSPNGSASASNGGSHELAGLDMNGSPKAPNLASAAHLTPEWEAGYNRLLFIDEGVLFSDSQIEVGLRSEYRAQLGAVRLYFLNKAAFEIGSFTTTLDNPSSSALKIDVKSLPDSNIGSQMQGQQILTVEAKTAFTDAPTIRISYLAGALQAYTLQLPIVIHKFMDPAALQADDFFKRWKQIGGAPRESQTVFATAKGKTIHDRFTRRIVEGFGWGILRGVDPNEKNVVGASVLNTSEGGKFGCLMRLEPNYDEKVCIPSLLVTVGL
jgi:AP-2 complex subunit alpha